MFIIKIIIYIVISLIVSVLLTAIGELLNKNFNKERITWISILKDYKKFIEDYEEDINKQRKNKYTV